MDSHLTVSIPIPIHLFHNRSLLPHLFIRNYSSTTMATTAVVMLRRIIASEGTPDVPGADSEPLSLGGVVIHTLDGRDTIGNLGEYRNAVFDSFAASSLESLPALVYTTLLFNQSWSTSSTPQTPRWSFYLR